MSGETIGGDDKLGLTSSMNSPNTPEPFNTPNLHNSSNHSSNLLGIHAPSKKPQLINPVVLAYMGDAVFELLVRQYLISLPNNQSHHLHREATKLVSAKAQREHLDRLQPHLTEEEADIVRRGRNAKSGAPPKNADLADYRQATALECLVGYLYFEGRLDRLGQLFQIVLGERDGSE